MTSIFFGLHYSTVTTLSNSLSYSCFIPKQQYSSYAGHRACRRLQQFWRYTKSMVTHGFKYYWSYCAMHSSSTSIIRRPAHPAPPPPPSARWYTGYVYLFHWKLKSQALRDQNLAQLSSACYSFRGLVFAAVGPRGQTKHTQIFERLWDFHNWTLRKKVLEQLTKNELLSRCRRLR